MEYESMELSAGNLLLVLAIVLAFYAIMWWRVFEKAGQPGWASIIPIYNLYILTKVAGKPGHWTILCLIPLVNIIFII